MELPELVIKNFRLKNCIVQGGMGVGVSLYPLAGNVAKEGGLGIISSAALDTVVSKRAQYKFNTSMAVRAEIELAKNDALGNGAIGINVMCALVGTYEDSVRAAIDAKVDAIISGAGLPLNLPSIKPPGHTALIPIVSSARALELIVKRWEKLSYRPDAVVLEGPMAGGHLGFKMREVENPEYTLENLLPKVLEVAHKYGDIPVIVAGGIYTHEDIVKFLNMGAKGVQIGTRFLATHESSATDEYKQAVIDSNADDIIVIAYPDITPASPCMLPFRILKGSPMYKNRRPAKCNKGYLLQRGPDGKLSFCQAMQGNMGRDFFLCICNGLISSAGYAPEELPLYTVGSNAYRVNKILSVKELMDELCGK
ncbi:MAG: nitronate monooxygenase [Candidatus Paceibacterota bacterium]